MASSVTEALVKLASGGLSSVELTTDCIRRIKAGQSSLNAFITIDEENALAAARASDKARKEAEPRPLEGIPIAVKDAILTKGLQTTAGSAILKGFVPPYSAFVVEKLAAAGGVIVGKTNMDEFAMGSSTEHSAYGPVHNPVLPARTPGGSSGGSAAAVAAGMVPAALGTDTGGSIRQPAAFTGTVGLKPTYGRVSRYGIVAYGSSLDQVGPITRSVEDAARVLQVIAGHDARDSTSAAMPVPDLLAAAAGPSDLSDGLRIGVPKEYFVEGIDAEVRKAVEATLASLASAGCEVKEVSLPHTKYAVATYYLVATSEASSNLSRYDGVTYGYRSPRSDSLHSMYTRTRSQGFGREVKRRIILGTYALSAGYYDAYYLKAQRVRSLIRQDFVNAFAEVDVLATPTAPTVAFELGEKLDDPLEMYLADVFTVSANLSGVPALSVPCGNDLAGAPIGLQLLAPWFKEDVLLAAGRLVEMASGQ